MSDSDSERSDSPAKIKSGNVHIDSDSADDIEPDVYTVERIVDTRINRGVTEYEVKWKNYPSSENTWEPEDNIFDKTLIDDFRRRRKAEKKKRQEKLEQWDSETKKLKDTQLKSKQEKKMLKNKRKDKLKGFIVSSDSDSSLDEPMKPKPMMPPPLPPPPPPMKITSFLDEKVQRKEKTGQKMDFKESGSFKLMKQRRDCDSLLDLEEPLSPIPTGNRDLKFKMEPGNKSGAKPRRQPSHQDVDISNMLGERKLKTHTKKVSKGKVLKDRTGALQNRTSKEKERIYIPKNLYTEAETGLGKGYKIDFVIGLRQNESGHLFYLVKYEGDQEEDDEYVEFVLSSIVVDHAPMKVIDYYQSILKFIPMSEMPTEYTKIEPDSDPGCSSSSSSSISCSADSEARDLELEPYSGTATETDSAKSELLMLDQVEDITSTRNESGAGGSSSVTLDASAQTPIEIEVITL